MFFFLGSFCNKTREGLFGLWLIGSFAKQTKEDRCRMALTSFSFPGYTILVYTGSIILSQFQNRIVGYLRNEGYFLQWEKRIRFRKGMMQCNASHRLKSLSIKTGTVPKQQSSILSRSAYSTSMGVSLIPCVWRTIIFFFLNYYLFIYLFICYVIRKKWTWAWEQI